MQERIQQVDITEVIKKQLNMLGINKGDTVLVHSSLKSLGARVSPLQIINALCRAVGDEGTLVLPALSYLHCNKNNLYFDYFATPSNVGAIPEYFRTQTKDVLRSMNPTHSCCALGENAEFITSGHILDNTPCGNNSPFRRVKKLGGKILFLGCGMKPNTSMHAVEELFEPDYLFGETYEYEMKGKDGKSFRHCCRAHDFFGVIQRYDRLEKLLSKGTEINTGNILKAFCHLVDAEAMWNKAGEAYNNNKYFFVDFI